MNIRPFEIFLIGIFALSAIGGLIYFSTYTPAQKVEETLYGSSVEVWGALDSRIMNDYLVELAKTQKALRVVHYTQIDKRSFQYELLNAIAEGRSPDLVIMPNNLLVTYRSKLQVIPFDTLSERTFRDTYIDGADIFMRTDGIYGLPIAVDPLVLYWNKDIFSTSGIATPPKTWETLVSQTTNAINKTDNSRNLIQSTVAFGEYVNVAHAKNILSTLLLQSGSDIVTEQNDGRYKVTFDQNVNQGLPPGHAVLSFYSQFAHPGSNSYSWNRSKGVDRTEFLNGDLALYFGMGSEKKSLDRDNANLNYDVAPIPQGGGSTVHRDYADFYALAIPRASKNIVGAYAVATYLTDPAQAQQFADMFDLAPVQRVLYTGNTLDPFRNILYQSALISHGWLDPDPDKSNGVFQDMVEETLADQSGVGKTVIDGRKKLEALFGK